MRLLVFSDIHGDSKALEAFMEVEADVYVAAGDLVNWARGLDAAGPILQKRAPKVWVLPGNHEHASDIEAFCAKFGLNPLHGKHFEIDGWTVAGFGHSNPTPFGTPGEISEQEFAVGLAPFARLDQLILICHCPPYGTPLDEAGPGKNFGSRTVREFIETNQPEWFFCGHIHEAEGRKTAIGRTLAVNAGKQGYLLEV